MVSIEKATISRDLTEFGVVRGEDNDEHWESNDFKRFDWI
jgi:arginine repressor